MSPSLTSYQQSSSNMTSPASVSSNGFPNVVPAAPLLPSPPVKQSRRNVSHVDYKKLAGLELKQVANEVEPMTFQDEGRD